MRGRRSTICFGAGAAALSLAMVAVPRAASGQSADAEIDTAVGRDAAERGAVDEARAAYERACLAERGDAAACLAWAELAAARPATDPDRERELKQALGSAVMLAPEDPVARYELALLLIEKRDWTWAIEHLEAALAAKTAPKDEALLRYTLGYAYLESGSPGKAEVELARAEAGLPSDVAQRCRFYRAVAAEKQGKGEEAAALFRGAGSGPDFEITEAVKARREAGTAFPRADGFRGQLSASLGMNTHPTAAVFDDPGQAGAPVLQSVFRGDLTFGAGSYEHGFLGAATLYRDQTWTEIGPRASAASDDRFYVANGVRASDTNLTHVQAQLGYAWRGFGRRFEHEVRLGVDVELQFLDHEVTFEDPPSGSAAVDPCLLGSYEASPDAFRLYAWAIGERAWWSFAKTKAATWSLQLKHEVRPNELEADRSANRFRLRVQNASAFLDRAMQLKAYAGGRYDRTYRDPAVIKYDRLMAEASAELKWNTPLEHLSVLVGGKLLYHWYMNSTRNEDNSFRPEYVSNPELTQAENAALESAYYDLARGDFEWELSAELQVDLWKGALLAVRYLHHQRISNIDDAPRPMIDSGGCGDAAYQRIPAQAFGYEQDVAALEIRQVF